MHKQSFNGSLQVPSAILNVGTLGQKEVFASRRNSEHKRLLRRRYQDSLLYLAEFEVENPAQLRLAE